MTIMHHPLTLFPLSLFQVQPRPQQEREGGLVLAVRRVPGLVQRRGGARGQVQGRQVPRRGLRATAALQGRKKRSKTGCQRELKCAFVA